jgi:hypothetical protein
MMPIAEVIHGYYDKKRKINYIRVTRMLRGDKDWGNFFSL